MPFSEEDDGATEGDENRETSGFVGSVFDGMDAPAGAQVTSIPSYEELSLLYDDFPVQGAVIAEGIAEKFTAIEAQDGRGNDPRALEGMVRGLSGWALDE
eukprot:g31254.t1